jgi:hypothetical protein
MSHDWRLLKARYPGTCRKLSGGCGGRVRSGETVLMRLPEPGRRHFTVLQCTRCALRNGLVVEVED